MPDKNKFDPMSLVGVAPKSSAGNQFDPMSLVGVSPQKKNPNQKDMASSGATPSMDGTQEDDAWYEKTYSFLAGVGKNILDTAPLVAKGLLRQASKAGMVHSGGVPSSLIAEVVSGKEAGKQMEEIQRISEKNALKGADELIPYERQKLAKGTSSITELYGKGYVTSGDAENIGYQVADGLIQMGIGAIPAVGGILLYSKNLESRYEDAKAKGFSDDKAFNESAVGALVETVIEKNIGVDRLISKGLGKTLSKEAIKDISGALLTKEAFQEAAKKYAKSFSLENIKQGFVKGFLPEAAEEFAQTYIDGAEQDLFDYYERKKKENDPNAKLELYDAKDEEGVFNTVNPETGKPELSPSFKSKTLLGALDASFYGGITGQMGGMFVDSRSFNPSIYSTLQNAYDSQGKEGLATSAETIRNGLLKASQDGKLEVESYNNALKNVDKIANNIAKFEQNSDINSYSRYVLYDHTERIIPETANRIARTLAEASTPIQLPTQDQIDDNIKNGEVATIPFQQENQIPEAYKPYTQVVTDEQGNKSIEASVPNSVVEAYNNNQAAIQTAMNNPLFAIDSLTNNNNVVTIEDLQRIGQQGGVQGDLASQLNFNIIFQANKKNFEKNLRVINYAKSISNNIASGQQVEAADLRQGYMNIASYNTGDTVFYNNKSAKIMEISPDGQSLKLSGVQQQVSANDENLRLQDSVTEQAVQPQEEQPSAETVNVEQPTAKVEAAPLAEEEQITEGRTMRDAVGELIPFTYDGETGEIYTTNSGVVTFESPNKVVEFGNIKDIGDMSIDSFGIVPQEMSIGDDYSVTIDGKKFTNKNQNPFRAITYDAEGNAVSIKLENENGKTRVIKGARATVIEAKYKVKQLFDESTREQLAAAADDAAKQAAAIEEARGQSSETPTPTENKPVEQAPTIAERERIKRVREIAERLAAEETEQMTENRKSVANLASSLFSAGIPVEVLNSEAIRIKYGKDVPQGMFLANDGTVVLNEDILASEWGKTIIFHEGTHPIINIIRNTEPKLYKQLVAAIKEEAKFNPEVNKILQQINASDAYADEFTRNDELVVEAIARIASGKLTLNNIKPTLRQAIVNFLNKIAKTLGFNQILKDSDQVAFNKLANQISDVLNAGRDISEIVGSKNVGKFGKTFSENVTDSDIQFRIIENEDFDDEKSMIDIMNSLGGVNIDVDITSDINSTGKLDISSIKSGQKGLVVQPKFVEIEDFTGKPILLTISDELTTGSVTNPVTGNSINNLFGGLNFNYTEGNTGYAWAYTAEENALTMLKQAKEMYAKNPDLYPDGIVPVAVVKMGKGAMSSNEAVIRQIIDNLSDKSIPNKNKKKALAVLKKDVVNVYNRIKKTNADIIKNKKKPTQSQKAAERGFEKIVELVNNSDSFESLLNNITSLNIGTRPLLIDRMTSGKAELIPDENRLSTNIPTLKALFEGMPKSELKRTNLGMLVNLISEESLQNVPDKHIISFVGIDATADAPIKIDTHPNYPFALKGKGLGIVSNTRHLASVMPSAYGNILNKVLENEVNGKIDTTKKYIISGLPAGLNNIALRNKSLNIKEADYNKILGYLNLSFPSVNFFVDNNSWNSLLSDKDVTQYKKEGDVIYAATKNGNVYINPAFDSSKTPIHKFGHIWLNSIESQNPELFAKGMSLIEGTEQLASSIKEYGDNLLARKDALSELMSNRGESIINAAKKSEFKEWLVSVFKYVQSQFKSLANLSSKQIENLTLSEFVDGAVKDILGGQKVVSYATKTINNLDAQMSDIDRAFTPEEIKNATEQVQFSDLSRDDKRIQAIRRNFSSSPKSEIVDALMSEPFNLSKEKAEDLVARAFADPLAPSLPTGNPDTAIPEGSKLNQKSKTVEEYNEGYDKAKKALLEDNVSLWDKMKKYVALQYDSRFFARRKLGLVSSSESLAQAKLRNLNGIAYSASQELAQHFENIFGNGLQEDGIANLDAMIFNLRILQIDRNTENAYQDEIARLTSSFMEVNGRIPSQKESEAIARSARVTIPIKSHGKTKNGQPATSETATAFLEALRNEIGENEYNMLKTRADLFRKVGNEQVEKLRKAGIISNEVASQYKDDFYAFRMTLDRLFGETDPNILILNGVPNIKGWAALSKEGTENYISQESRLMLVQSYLGTARAIAKNAFREAVYSENISVDKNGVESSVRDLNGNQITFIKPANYVRDNQGNIRSNGKELSVREAEDGYVNVPFKKDGVIHYFQMEKETFDQIEGNNIEWKDSGLKSKWGNAYYSVTDFANRMLTAFATRKNPFFFIGNVPMDLQQQVFFTDIWTQGSLVQSNVYSAGARAIARTIKFSDFFGMNKDFVDKTLEEYIAAGGAMDRMSMMKEERQRSIELSLVGHATDSKGKLIKDKMKSIAFGMNERTEIAMRLAAYDQSKKNLIKKFEEDNNGAKPNEAQMLKIQEIAAAKSRAYTDFAQRGTSLPNLNVAYLNSSIQAAGAAAEYIYDNPVKAAEKLSQLAIGKFLGTMAIMALMGDAYDDLDEYRKDMYSFLFSWDTGKKDENGKPIYVTADVRNNPTLIPFLGVARTMAEKTMRALQGKEQEDVKVLGTADRFFELINQASPIPIPNVTSIEGFKDSMARLFTKHIFFNTAAKMLMGYDAFRGKNIISERDKELSPYMRGQDDPNIPYFYKVMARSMSSFSSDNQISPATMQSVAETFITSPRTNIFVALGYGVLSDAANVILPAKTEKERGEFSLWDSSKALKSITGRFASFTDSEKTQFRKNEELYIQSKEESMKFNDVERVIDNRLKDFMKNDKGDFFDNVKKMIAEEGYEDNLALFSRINAKANSLYRRDVRGSMVSDDIINEVRILHYTQGAEGKAKLMKYMLENDTQKAEEVFKSMLLYGTPPKEVFEAKMMYEKSIK